jgi:hypothetical protein
MLRTGAAYQQVGKTADAGYFHQFHACFCATIAFAIRGAWPQSHVEGHRGG